MHAELHKLSGFQENAMQNLLALLFCKFLQTFIPLLTLILRPELTLL